MGLWTLRRSARSDHRRSIIAGQCIDEVCVGIFQIGQLQLTCGNHLHLMVHTAVRFGVLQHSTSLLMVVPLEDGHGRPGVLQVIAAGHLKFLSVHVQLVLDVETAVGKVICAVNIVVCRM